MLPKGHIVSIVLLLLTASVFSQHRSYTDKYEYKKKRHEVTLGLGAALLSVPVEILPNVRF